MSDKKFKIETKNLIDTLKGLSEQEKSRCIILMNLSFFNYLHDKENVIGYIVLKDINNALYCEPRFFSYRIKIDENLQEYYKIQMEE